MGGFIAVRLYSTGRQISAHTGRRTSNANMSENMNTKKFVLVSNSGYSAHHDQMLESLLDQNYELFCVVGKDCQAWEDAMDEIAVGDGRNPRFINTTSHPGEDESEVIEFAQAFSLSVESDVKVVYV